MINIHKFDGEWPEDDSDCQDLLHKILTYSQLKLYIRDIGEEKYEIVKQRFGQLHSYGIDELSKIDKMKSKLINRIVPENGN